LFVFRILFIQGFNGFIKIKFHNFDVINKIITVII